MSQILSPTKGSNGKLDNIYKYNMYNINKANIPWQLSKKNGCLDHWLK